MKAYPILILAVALGACTAKSKEKESKPAQAMTLTLSDEQLKAIAPTLITPEKKEWKTVRQANGRLDAPPQNITSIHATTAAFVKKTELLPGMKIRKGQVIAELEHPDFIQWQQDYWETKHQLDYYQQENARQEELAKENINAQKVRQQANAQYEATKVKWEGLKAKLAMLPITPNEKEPIQRTVVLRSPVEGFVMQMNVNQGKFVRPEDELFRLLDADHLHAELWVFEKDLPFIQIGQRVAVRLSNEKNTRVATVYLIGHEIREDRTVMVHCHFTKHDNTLVPGTFITGEIETQKKSVTTLPEKSIVRIGDKQYVYTPQDKRTFHLVEIMQGECREGVCEITFVNEAPTEVVLQGAYEMTGLLMNNEE